MITWEHSTCQTHAVAVGPFIVVTSQTYYCILG